MKYIGKRLKKLRVEKGITQQELADIVGCSKVSISRYESGLREFGIEDIDKLCNYFNVDADYLLCLTNTKISQRDCDSSSDPHVDTSSLDKLTDIKINDIKEIVTNKNYLITLLTDEIQYSDAQDYLNILNELTSCRDKLADLLHTVDSLK